MTLIWERRRLVCEPCGSRFSEGHQGFEGRVTARLARRLVKDARAMTVNAAAKRHQVSWKLVNSLVVAWAGLVGEHRRRQRCRVLLVDETSIRKRHRYVTVLVNGDTGEVLAMVPHRDTQALSGFLAAQGPRWCKAVKVVVSDGSARRTKQRSRRGSATPATSWTGSTSSDGSKQGWSRSAETSSAAPKAPSPLSIRDVFRARFLLMRRPDKLDAADQARLDVLFAAHPRLNPAWDALGELHGLYLADDHKGAMAALDRFADIYAHRPDPRVQRHRRRLPGLACNQILDWHRTPGGPATAASKAPTTCSRSFVAEPTASPTTPTSKPAVSY